MAYNFLQLTAANQADFTLMLDVLNTIQYKKIDSADQKHYYAAYAVSPFTLSNVIKMKQPYTATQFNTSIIPTADWTNIYKLSVAPTVTEATNYTETITGGNTYTFGNQF